MRITCLLVFVAVAFANPLFGQMLPSQYYKSSTGMFCDLLEHPEETVQDTTLSGASAAYLRVAVTLTNPQ